MNSSISTWRETIAMGMICAVIVTLALLPNERLFPLLISTAIALTERASPVSESFGEQNLRRAC